MKRRNGGKVTEVGGAPLSLSQAVLGQLRRLDLLLCERAKALQAQRADASQDLRGLFISDGEFEELLQRPFGQALLDAAVEDGKREYKGFLSQE